MNYHELESKQILQDLIQKYGSKGLKVSFEDEGITLNELLRVKDICSQLNTHLNLKIGGVEAVRDLKDAMAVGVSKIVAPMVESSFALAKFVNSFKKYVEPYLSECPLLGINIETQQAIENLDQILSAKEAKNISTFTIGRCDLVFSLGKDRTFINDDEVFAVVEKALKKIKKCGFQTVMGGAISIDSIPFIEKLYFEGILDFIETRYVIFDLKDTINQLNEALDYSARFEIEILKGRYSFYQPFLASDIERVKMIEKRLTSSKQLSEVDEYCISNRG